MVASGDVPTETLRATLPAKKCEGVIVELDDTDFVMEDFDWSILSTRAISCRISDNLNSASSASTVAVKTACLRS